MFSKPEFKELFASYHLVQIYTDVVPNHLYSRRLRAKFGNSVARQEEDAEANRDFQEKAFGTEQLPLYVILEPLPNGRIEWRSYAEGKINNEEAFARFLREPLEVEAPDK